MVQIAMLLLAFPLGFFIRNRTSAIAATAVVFIVVSVPQALTTPQRNQISYWVVQALTVLVAYVLLRWGSAIGARRRAKQLAA
jgi:type III secretory pathway component EscS